MGRPKSHAPSHAAQSRAPAHLDRKPSRPRGRNSPAWLPSPSEIREMAAQIRAGWTAAQHRQRGCLPKRIQLQPVRIHVDLSDLGD